METEPRRRSQGLNPGDRFESSRSYAIPIIDSVQFQIIDDTRCFASNVTFASYSWFCPSCGHPRSL
jgi:hypothetical protein